MSGHKEILSQFSQEEDAHLVSYRVPREELVEVVRQLRETPDMSIIDLTAVEYPEELAGVYHFMSIADYELFRIKVPLAKDDLHLPSISHLYTAANEMEREVYDLFGIVYDGHPNLTRIFLADDFEGHPLRKDYVSNTRD